MKKGLCWMALLFGAMFLAASCSEEDDTFDKYADWTSRNATYFDTVTDSALTAINGAKAAYGDDWEAHCEWRRMLSATKANTGSNATTDYVCARILERAAVERHPYWNDSVRVHYRGWLMQTDVRLDDGTMVPERLVFDQTYKGTFNEEIARPALLGVSSCVPGFATVLTYMSPGDCWRVYIPSTLAYGSTATGDIPAGSTLCFEMRLAAVYPEGTNVPDWK
ncbi:MAG: FKBP-type peptidyl-prolyl cis-trans isomerase [Paraprevotella sp.]|nr:FKBP-type peptidyl-prolyl cis-trans isomerase [Paraprevotella sp.]